MKLLQKELYIDRFSLLTIFSLTKKKRRGPARLAVALTQWKPNGFGQSISPGGPAMLKVQDRYGLAVSTMLLNYLAVRHTTVPTYVSYWSCKSTFDISLSSGLFLFE